jgi:formate/nitrite transporter FocA (FNT family)
MLFQPKMEVIPFKDFLAQKESVKAPTALLTAVTATYMLSTQAAQAAGIQERIISAFDPIIQLAQGVAYPIAFLMVIGSFVLVMIGQKSKGITMLKWAAIGYLGIQFAPVVMQILVDVGTAMKK